MNDAEYDAAVRAAKLALRVLRDELFDALGITRLAQWLTDRMAR